MLMIYLFNRHCAPFAGANLERAVFLLPMFLEDIFVVLYTSASVSYARRLRDVDGLRRLRDVDGLLHIGRLSELVRDKLSICLSSFAIIFRNLFDFFARLSAKLTKLSKFLNNEESSPELDVPGPCPVDCHGDCSRCALM